MIVFVINDNKIYGLVIGLIGLVNLGVMVYVEFYEKNSLEIIFFYILYFMLFKDM